MTSAHFAQASAIDCQRCGACCAHAADWPRFTLETEAAISRIPTQLIDGAGGGMRCTGARCDALQGSVGDQVSCTIYTDRPHVCRDCAPGDNACTIARAGAGLMLVERAEAA